MEKKNKIESVKDEIVVDSRDVDRATEIALRRRNAAVQNEVSIGDRVVDEEILSSPEKRPASRKD